tara:strand:+ start:7036 stop:7251 length:216 start_codon:yes stop_codon:yes gene_type:complete
MNWQWVVFLIGSYVAGAYILRYSLGNTPKKKHDYSGVTLAFIFSPIWVWFWSANFVIEKGFAGIGRWISGE